MKTRSPHILIVDDEPDIRQLIGEILTDFNYLVTEVHDAAAARTAVRLQQFDAVLLDIWMPGDDGITLLKEWHSVGFTTPVIMLSAHGSIETAVEATRYGAYDYLEKPVSVGRLEITVRNAIRNSQIPIEYTIKSKPVVQLDLVGNSSVIASLRAQVKKLAQLRTHLIVIGEIGSGREAAVRMLHQERGKDNDSFKSLNWLMKEAWQQSIPEALEEAASGTILVRDLHAYDKYSQNQVLGLLNEISTRRANEDDSNVPDVVATTTPSIFERMNTGKLRPELFHRLNENQLVVPPLRDHLEDIPELVGYLVDKFSRAGEMPYKRISTAALNRLRNHPWQGNVEELKNVLLKAIQGSSSETITEAEVQTLLETWEAPEIEQLDDGREGSQIFGFPYREAKENFEREYLRYHIQRSKSLTEAAEKIGLHRASIFRKTRELGIEVNASGEIRSDAEDDADS